jgi:hypothetical protein
MEILVLWRVRGESVEGNKKIKFMDLIDVEKDNENEDSDNDIKSNS